MRFTRWYTWDDQDTFGQLIILMDLYFEEFPSSKPDGLFPAVLNLLIFRFAPSFFYEKNMFEIHVIRFFGYVGCLS